MGKILCEVLELNLNDSCHKTKKKTKDSMNQGLAIYDFVLLFLISLYTIVVN